MSRKSTPEYFWSRVDKSGECWKWTGATFKFGYGLVQYHGRTRYSHRLAYEFSVGSIPDGLCVLHSCDNPPCCRPSHLFLGTRSDNNRDMIEKGRGNMSLALRGAQTAMARLTEDQVREIRSRYQPKKTSQYLLGREYGVSRSTIEDVIHRRTWSHLIT